MLHIVLYQPENAANLGNIIRTAYIFQAKISLIRPYGWIGNLRYFEQPNDEFKNAELIRATMGCIEQVEIVEYDSWADFYQQVQKQNNNLLLYFSKHKAINLQKYLQTEQIMEAQNLFLIFGSETFGLTKLEQIHVCQPRIMLEPIATDKSYNLANSVAISLYAFWIHFGKN
ncbi:tRNA (cytidine/uridine-2'-O-)-methyltransferase [Mycoplasmoides fastidiosum]|uniref:tRNA (Cytidine/uridine-2'-O-)-methyltransferase n=1 Tax=Mycoplasmoides fastidiosum TaxID=92758 RepID=A0ABU0LZU9_9BACT|nr:TrmH family RNA methyltransferase [Mycoplasmoides fastidiosum]MDQ0514236.1 tRNA (cytidine/uridine-2'-O-)-methyltransferase [Mycoplasmoides fastidiosum]UUD37357.1 hypothetical protein NPA10_02110 [Mycoplasmoides fastidiosum]